MNTVEEFAIAKVIGTTKAKALGKSLEEGEYDIDMVVRIFGKITIKNGEKKSTVSIPLLKSLALALHYSGCQRENLIPALEKAIKASMELDQDKISEVLGMDFKQIQKLEKRIKEEIVDTLPMTPAVTTNSKLIAQKMVEEVKLQKTA